MELDKFGYKIVNNCLNGILADLELIGSIALILVIGEDLEKYYNLLLYEHIPATFEVCIPPQPPDKLIEYGSTQSE